MSVIDRLPRLLVPLGIALIAAAAASAAFADEIHPFNGENLTGWRIKKNADHASHWTVGRARLHPEDPRKFVVESGGSQLINAEGHGVDLYSDHHYGDAVIELDVMVPKGGNSGIFLQGEYEVQVLDSYGDKPVSEGDMGAIYGVAPPHDPKYRPPGEWQHFRIVFRAPRFNRSGRKVRDAVFVRVELNGRTILKNVVIHEPTSGGLTGKEHAEGPLLLQGNQGPVAYRDVVIRPMDKAP